MNGVLLGCITTALNNLIDNFFLILLLFKEIKLNKKNKGMLLFWFLLIVPGVAGYAFIFEQNEPLRALWFHLISLLSVSLIPVLVARREIAKYEICYILNFLCVLLVSMVILGISVFLVHADMVYFHISDLSKIPEFLISNAVYIALSYASYRLAKIVLKSYNYESKFQNAIVFIYAGGVHAFGVYAFLQFYSESRLLIRGISSIFACVALASLGLLIFTFYQNKLLHRENKLIQRHREKEMEYYARLEENQLTIRKLRHDILNYVQAIRQMNGKEERVGELLDELESRLR